MLKQLITCVIFILCASGMSAQKTHVVVEVKGLSCPFCAYGLEKQFMEFPGVANLQIDVESGLLAFDWVRDTEVDKKEIRKRVTKAGFTAGKINVMQIKVKNDTVERRFAGSYTGNPKTSASNR